MNLNGDGPSGLPPRPKYQASHGTTVEMHGTPAASQASDTGLTVSGVEVVSMRSIASPVISSLATCALRCGFDWLSLSMTTTSYDLPSMVRPWPSALRASSRT